MRVAFVGGAALLAFAGVVLTVQQFQTQTETAVSVTVPLVVEELLPAGQSGWNRTNATATFGIPLAENANITNVNQLGLTGASAAQFREIRRWPNGSLQWVLVDAFVPSLDAGQTAPLTLTGGSGAFPGGQLAVDAGTTITINTTAAQFSIRKNAFNVIDSAIVGGRTFIQAGHAAGLWLTGADDVRYAAGNDQTVQVRIEENGPVRTSIRADGTLTSAAGVRHLDYTLRMHFTRGSSRVKFVLTYRNARQAELGKKTFKAAGLSLPTTLINGSYTFPLNDGRETGVLGTDSAYLFQAYAKRLIAGQPDEYLQIVGPTVGTQQGVEVRHGATVDHALGSDQQWSTGWARLSENGTGASVTAAINHLSEFWGSGFELSTDGSVDLQVFSPHNAALPLNFTWGAHDTRQFALDFTVSAPVGAAEEATLAALQYPLFGRADYLHYASTKAIFGTDRLVTDAEYNQFLTATEQETRNRPSCNAFRQGMLSTENADYVWRVKKWQKPGGNNQLDKSVAFFLDYLRTGKGGFFLRAYHESRYKGDQAAVRCDDCDLKEVWGGINPNTWAWGDSSGGYNGGGISDNTFESNRNHPHWPSTAFAWELTGETQFQDDIREIADYLAVRENGNYGAMNRVVATYNFGSGGLRGWPNSLRDHALFSEFLAIPREQQALRFMTDQLLNSRDGGGCSNGVKNDGRNLERGFLYSQGHMDCPDGRGNSFYHQHFVPLGVWEAIRVLKQSSDPADQSRVAGLEDFLLGHAEFVAAEIFKYNRSAAEYEQDGWRTPYRISYQYPNPVTTAAQPDPEKYRREDYFPAELSWAYERTGNALFLEQGQGMFCRLLDIEPDERGSDLSSQEFIWTWLRRDQLGGGFVAPAKTNLGGGQWRLQWTAPANAVSYAIRSSSTPIVEHSLFDDQRTDPGQLYLYPPGQHTPYWNATALSGTPTPQPAGSPESVTVTPPAGQTEFVIEYRTSGARADTTPPVLSNLLPPQPVQSGAGFRFGLDTNEPATCKYGMQVGEAYKDKPYYFRFTGSTLHRSSSLPNFPAGNYTYYVQCKDRSGNVNPSDTVLSFSVQSGSDITPPLVVDSQPSGLLPSGSTSASLQATTDESATCRYGTLPGVPFEQQPIALTSADGLHHTVALAGLQDGSTYTFYLRCRDGAGNAMTNDTVVTFSVDAAPSGDVTPPVIMGVSPANVTQSGASITWTTDEPADSQVEYGATAAYGSFTALDPVLSTSHSQTLSGLSAGTLYHYRVKSRDAAGNPATSPDATFTTQSVPPDEGTGWTLKIDFNNYSATPESLSGTGWENLIPNANSMYAAAQGWGFSTVNMYGISGTDRGTGTTVERDFLRRSSSLPSGDARNSPTFRIDVPRDGQYDLIIYRGDVSGGNDFTQPMKVEEDAVLIGQIPPASPINSVRRSDPIRLTVDDGALNLRFTMDGICTPGSTCSWGVNGLEVMEVVTACGDGTALNACSTTKPKYCDGTATLVNRCTLCGCPSGQNCSSSTGACSSAPAPKKPWWQRLLAP